jgi:predicted TIM-barrel fold metal-dependent hydrolase
MGHAMIDIHTHLHPPRLFAAIRRSDRVVYGTDFPNIPYAYEREHAGLAALGLPDASLEAIVRGNARRLLAAAGVA